MFSRLTTTSRLILRGGPAATSLFSISRTLATHASTSTRRRFLPRPHEYAKPSAMVASWKDSHPRCDPRQAKKRLDKLRADYRHQVKDLRKSYAFELQLQRQEKERRREARLESIRIAKEQRKGAKEEAREARAARHKASQEEVHQIVLKEKAERLEFWRAKEVSREAKANEKRELINRQSSTWIEESDFEKKIRGALLDPHLL